jgi:hypothetical protein
VFLVADEVNGSEVFVGFESSFDSFDDHFATVVATHDIHCDAHSVGTRRRRTAPRTVKRPP